MPRVTAAGWVVAGFGALAAVHAWTAPGGLIGSAPLLLAPLAAALFAFAAVRQLPPSAGGPWTLMGLGAAAAALGAILTLVIPRTVATLFPAAAATHVGVAGGLAWMVHQRDRHRQAEIALDLIMVIGAVLLALVRWAPGVQAVLASGSVPLTVHLRMVVAPTAGACGVAFALVLLFSLRSSRAGGPCAAIAGSAVLLAISAAPPAFGMLFTPKPYTLAAVAGWGLLAYSGSRVAAGGAHVFIRGDADPGSTRLRQAVAPLVAVLLAVLVVDAGIRAPLTHTTAIIAGLVAAFLALRVSRLLEATKDRQVEQRQLAQNRALVEVSRALAGATDLDSALTRVADWSARLLDARSAVIELLSDDGRTLEVRAAVGFPPEFLGLRFPVEGSFTGWVVRNGMPRTTLDPATEPDIQAKSRRFLPRCPVASAPLRFHDRMLGVLSSLADDPFDRHDMELLGALADQAAVAIENARLFEEVNRLSMTDPLTGLANRRCLEEELLREFSAAMRGRRLIAVMFDLNEFKEYNDRYGHLAGDEALKLFGAALATETRSMNLAARYGGDEFVALLGDSSEDGAQIFAQRVKRRYARSVARLGRRPIGVAVGIASFSRGMTSPEHLIAAADAALYAMKTHRSRAG